MRRRGRPAQTTPARARVPRPVEPLAAKARIEAAAPLRQPDGARSRVLRLRRDATPAAGRTTGSERLCSGPAEAPHESCSPDLRAATQSSRRMRNDGDGDRSSAAGTLATRSERIGRIARRRRGLVASGVGLAVKRMFDRVAAPGHVPGPPEDRPRPRPPRTRHDAPSDSPSARPRSPPPRGPFTAGVEGTRRLALRGGARKETAVAGAGRTGAPRAAIAPAPSGTAAAHRGPAGGPAS